MYTTHCEDPDCENCRYWRQNSGVRSENMMAAGKQATMPLVQSFEEENRNQILWALEESIKVNLRETADEKESYFKSVEKVKDVIHSRISCLIEVLRQRERDLYRQVEQSWRNELERIHFRATFKSLSKGVPETSPYELDFKCEFDFILSELKNFGRVSNELIRKTDETSFKQLQVHDVTPSTLLLDTSLESAAMPVKNEKYEKLIKNLKEKLYAMERMVPKVTEEGLKRLENLEILSDLQRCARKTENIKNESGLQRLENLEILNELQECARRDERLKMLAKSIKPFDPFKPFDECLDSVQSKEVEKDNSSVTIPKSMTEDDASYISFYDVGLPKNVTQISNDEVQKFEDPAKSLEKEVKDSSKLKGRNHSLRELRNSLLQMKLACMTDLDNGSDLLLGEKWEKAHNDLKKEIQQFEEKQNSACGTEFGKYDASDEDDMEIISRSEAASIPSEIPAIPPKNRFRFGRKRSWCPSLYAKKSVVRKNANSPSKQSPGEISPTDVIRSFVENMPSTNEQANPEPFRKCLEIPGSSNVDDCEGMKKLLISARLSDVKRKEIPPVNAQETSSSDKGEGRDPSGALRSSFRRYLEKNPEDEWLSSSEQLQPAGNGCMFHGDGLFLEENLDKWLSAKDKQNLVADWLYTPRI